MKRWTWKNDFKGSDPSDLYCEVKGGDFLEWFGESHHPLWKGWFEIGQQSFSDFLRDGPPQGSYAPETVVAQVRAYVLKKGAAASNPNLPAKSQVSAVPSSVTAPVGTAELTVILHVEGWPDNRLTDVIFEFGSKCLYERHTFGLSRGGLGESERVRLCFREFPAGKYPFYLHTEVTPKGLYGVEHARIEGTLEFGAGEFVTCEFRVRIKKVRLKKTVRKRTLPRVSCVLVRSQPISVNLIGVLAYLDGCRILDLNDSQETIQADVTAPDATVLAQERIPVFAGALASGSHRVELHLEYLVPGESDRRKAQIIQKFRVPARKSESARPPLEVEVSWRPAIRSPSARQKGKIARITTLEAQILSLLRSGSEYRDSDKEGGWRCFRARDGQYVCESGSHASGSQSATRDFADGGALIEAILKIERLRHASKEPREVLLVRILDAVTRS